jgi:hypothetical protein
MASSSSVVGFKNHIHVQLSVFILGPKKYLLTLIELEQESKNIIDYGSENQNNVYCKAITLNTTLRLYSHN